MLCGHGGVSAFGMNFAQVITANINTNVARGLTGICRDVDVEE
jgi:hypothetical protein